MAVLCRGGAAVLFVAAAAMAVALLALTVTSHVRAARRVTLFDVDGPSARDPAKAAWDKGGMGTADWMENKQPKQVYI